MIATERAEKAEALKMIAREKAEKAEALKMAAKALED